MKVKFLQSIGGPTWEAQPGQVLEVNDAEALRFFNAGIAEPAIEQIDTTTHGSASAVYVAVAPEGEKATGRRGRDKRKN